MITAFRLITTTFILAIFTVSTATVQAEDYRYETNNGTITITGYAGPAGHVTIPDSINGLPVKSIGDDAFRDCTNLTSINIPNSVTSIGNGTFWGCTNLTSVIIPNSVTSIGIWVFVWCSSLTSITIPNSVTSIEDGAFAYCTSLTSITIPDSVTNIGNAAFSSCTSLTAIYVDPAHSAYSSVGGVLFNRDLTTLVVFPGGKAGSYTIPNSVTCIGGWAFTGCTSLTNVTIPNSVTSIEGGTAFGHCISLTSITIPDSVTNIGSGAFQSCTGLTNVSMGNRVTYIGGWAFSGCTSLQGIYCGGNAPTAGEVFSDSTLPTVYYLPGTTGWSTTFGGRPTAPWFLPYPVILTTAPNFGVQTSAFGFRISWATNASVVVDAATILANPIWLPVSTNILVDGSSYFTDAEWTNYPTRLYRIRWP